MRPARHVAEPRRLSDEGVKHRRRQRRTLQMPHGFATLALVTERELEDLEDIDDEAERLRLAARGAVAQRRASAQRPVSDWAAKLTLAGAEAAYIALVIFLVVRTLHSPHLRAAHVSASVAATTGTLAAAFAVGYATVLGVPPAPEGGDGLNATKPVKLFRWLGAQFSLRNLLALGVFLYMAAGAALGLTYLTHTVEAPSVVKTISVAFGGYVVAYIGKAYKDYTG